MDASVTLRPVDADNWRAVAALTVTEVQRAWVAEPAYYLALCHYSPVGWRPLAVTDADGTVVGFLMWAVDPEDGAAWLGGITIDATQQGKGFGRAAVSAALTELDAPSFALSYQPDNTAARALYASLGFVETGELEDDEVVARRPR
ncbi:diamine N-acetyltransferase [Asanoa ferruginea]|uniref:Diamine N-acetyltransferase n=1 Tax=Asanoa ferruginea TaxID=53367 RepID=A0A3D9ZBW8_9ACTN|nr:GNAT family N-acetyltransferase [Asanoa ferruginea]REF94898.1 diamine N-acetyltransferase [Asanoa ferruginea]GIF45522.1 N-acetyltransferase [Asanoa ferruginea]